MKRNILAIPPIGFLVAANSICCDPALAGRDRMQVNLLKRRDFVALLGGAALAWPLSPRAQHPAMPVIGFLTTLGSNDRPNLREAFRRGLSEVGYSRDAMWRSNTVSRKTNTTDCQRLQPIWSAARWL